MRLLVGHAEYRFDALADLLVDGDPSRAGACVEIVSGAGQLTGLLSEIFRQVLTVDISNQLLADPPTGLGSSIQAEGAALPIVTGSMAAVVCIDVVPCPEEIRRVLRSGGVLALVNPRVGEHPMLPDIPTLVGSLGRDWNAVEVKTRWGSWTLMSQD
jgi:SAM-dependent methyltransferase